MFMIESGPEVDPHGGDDGGSDGFDQKPKKNTTPLKATPTPTGNGKPSGASTDACDKYARLADLIWHGSVENSVMMT
jgi:hypothetical protein